MGIQILIMDIHKHAYLWISIIVGCCPLWHSKLAMGPFPWWLLSFFSWLPIKFDWPCGQWNLYFGGRPQQMPNVMMSLLHQNYIHINDAIPTCSATVAAPNDQRKQCSLVRNDNVGFLHHQYSLLDGLITVSFRYERRDLVRLYKTWTNVFSMNTRWLTNWIWAILHAWFHVYLY